MNGSVFQVAESLDDTQREIVGAYVARAIAAARAEERARCATITDPANQDYGTFADPESARKIVEILHKAIVGVG